MAFFDKPSEYNSSDYRSRNYRGIWQKKFIDEYIDSIFKIGEDRTLAEFSNSKTEHFPESLYKFYSPSIHNLINLQLNRLHLSFPRNFNDPFDSFVLKEDDKFIKYSILQGIKNNNLISNERNANTLYVDEYRILKNAPLIGKYREELGRSNSFMSMFRYYKYECQKSEGLFYKLNTFYSNAKSSCRDKVEIIRNKPFRVTCFSALKDEVELGKNLTMWSHYADSHKGFCVKYSTKFENNKYINLLKCGFLPVNYTTKIPKITFTDYKNLSYSQDEVKLNASILKKVYKSLITKSSFWNYEKEWRLIIGSENEEYLSDNCMTFPNIEEIYIGCRASTSLKKAIVNFADSMKIKAYIAKQSEDQFQLDFREITNKILKDDEYYSRLFDLNRKINKTDRDENIFNKLLP